MNSQAQTKKKFVQYQGFVNDTFMLRLVGICCLGFFSPSLLAQALKKRVRGARLFFEV